MWEEWSGILEKAKNGDQNSIEYVIKKYEPLVKSRASKYFIKGYEHDDLVQEGNLTILKAIKKFDAKMKSNFTSYCDMALRNNFSYMLREMMKKDFEVSLESKSEEFDLLEVLTDGISIESLFFENIQKKELLIVLNKLSEENKKLIYFLYGEEKNTLSSWCKENNMEYFKARRKKDKILAEIKRNLLNI